MKEALYCKKENNDIKCILCPHNCVIGEGFTGLCKVRSNVNGKLMAQAYNKFTSINIDPIEKKPLYHFYPAKSILSLGSIGCNLSCSFCQNWQISQSRFGEIPMQDLTPKSALKMCSDYQQIGIAYTYNEPLINFEWILETSKLLRRFGYKNVLVTNGYINEEPWKELIEYIDAANIDIKAFSGDYYKNLCNGDLDVVKNNIEIFVKAGRHLELTNLVISGKNDSNTEIEDLTDWVSSLSKDIPMHFSRYYPQYKMEDPQTEIDSLIRAYNIAKAKLNYVYMGNVMDEEYSKTFCPKCGAILLQRRGYRVINVSLNGGVCKNCNEKISVIV